MSPRNSTNAALVCRGTVWPRTSPDCVFSAGEERQRAVPVVLEAVSLGASGRERQHRVETVERLNGRFLVNGEDRRVVRRIDIQTDHVGGLRLEVGIVRLHVALEAVGLETRALPGLRDEGVINHQYASQSPCTPVR